MNQSAHPLYARWRFWGQVCNNSNNPSYKYVGAKGVKIGFNSFWEMARYVEEHLGDPPLGSASRLARIDLDGDYAPGNLRWETGSELVSRSSHAVLLTYLGRTQCISAWAREAGVKRATIQNRLQKWGWPIERALEKKKYKNEQKKIL